MDLFTQEIEEVLLNKSITLTPNLEYSMLGIIIIVSCLILALTIITACVIDKFKTKNNKISPTITNNNNSQIKPNDSEELNNHQQPEQIDRIERSHSVISVVEPIARTIQVMPPPDYITETHHDDDWITVFSWGSYDEELIEYHNPRSANIHV